MLSRILARDVQSVTGKTLKLISDASGLNLWTASKGRLKAAFIAGDAVEIPQQDRWRLPYLYSLLSQRREAHNQALEEHEDRLTELIDSLVGN